MTNVELLTHAGLAALTLVGYIVLTVLGLDGTVLLGVLGGQGLTVGTSKAIDKAAG